MPADPSSTEKPSCFSRATYQAADWYSRQAVSPKSKMVRVHADSDGWMPSRQASAVACSFAMPLPPGPNDEIDLEKVDIGYTPSGGGAKLTFPQVASASACGAAGGFYYDNPSKPTTINLCPASCTKVQTDSGAKVDIFLGCIKKGPA